MCIEYAYYELILLYAYMYSLPALKLISFFILNYCKFSEIILEIILFVYCICTCRAERKKNNRNKVLSLILFFFITLA